MCTLAVAERDHVPEVVNDLLTRSFEFNHNVVLGCLQVYNTEVLNSKIGDNRDLVEKN